MSRKSDEEKAKAYDLQYLLRRRLAVEELEKSLVRAKRALLIAEAEYKAGEMVTGEEDGVPALLRGIVDIRRSQEETERLIAKAAEP